jgi:Mlc titration factor MtfA (ptsG expression regulator)
VILSWSQLLVEAREPELGYNVALHEFAHQLDFLTNSIDGTPPLGDRILERRWQLTMQEAFERHRSRLAQGQETFFTDHAGDHETEFFADATEAFYCRPHDLESEEPEVFSLLQAYFRVDPRVWFPEEAP